MDSTPNDLFSIIYKYSNFIFTLKFLHKISYLSIHQMVKITTQVDFSGVILEAFINKVND